MRLHELDVEKLLKKQETKLLVCDGCYTFVDYVEGEDLFEAIHHLTNEQKISIGKEIAMFLGELQEVTSDLYDIGHYIPTIPKFQGSWKDGHLEYAKLLEKELTSIDFERESKKAISVAFDHIFMNIWTLDYQVGPRLLHNDFHPKNIIVNNGKLAGIIDWECSQFGEADFELAHLLHWGVYEFEDNKLDLLLQSIVEHTKSWSVPNIEQRMMIYQLEHELNQLIWHGKKDEEKRIKRINSWLTGNELHRLLTGDLKDKV